MERQRLEQGRDPLIQKDIEDHCSYLKQHIVMLEKQIQECINKDTQLQRLSEVLQSFPGVGTTSAAVLLADLPELGHIGPKEIASLVGVAPFNHESGTMARKSSIRGGRLSVRCILYMVALVAILHNPPIREYYNHLKAQQKPSKVAIVACMRKILVILNAITTQFFKNQAISIT